MPRRPSRLILVPLLSHTFEANDESLAVFDADGNEVGELLAQGTEGQEQTTTQKTDRRSESGTEAGAAATLARRQRRLWLSAFKINSVRRFRKPSQPMSKGTTTPPSPTASLPFVSRRRLRRAAALRSCTSQDTGTSGARSHTAAVY
jgi:hypothetical protein